MKTYIKTFTVAFLSLAAATLKSDVFTNSYTVSQLSNKSAIYELVSQMLVGPGVSVRPGGSLFDPTTSSQVGFFSNLVARVAPTFTNGVILSTGLARTGNVTTNFWSGTTLENEGINTNPYAEAGSDDDLYTYFKKSGELTGYDDALYDPAGIILYIQPTNKTINIPFVLASEEFNYFDWYDDNQPKEGHVNVADLPTLNNYRDQSDKFAFFLQEIGPNAEFDDGEITNDDISCMTNNIARFPDGGNIGIASVNPHTNTNYFVSNVVICKGVDMWGDEYEYLNFPTNDLSLPMEFNGAIVGLVAVAKNLDTNKIYKLKIMLADHNSNAYTSALFLRDRGITSGAELKIDVTGPAYLPEPGPVTFTNTVSSDRWAAPADNVVVTNYLPAGVQKSMLTEPWCSAGEIDSGSWDKIDETGYFVWRIGSDFAAGSNAVMTIDCNLTDLGAGVYTNLATVAASDGDYDWSNNTDKCVTRVGNVKPLLTIAAITTNKVQGTEMVLPALQFVASAIDDAGVPYQVSDIVKEIGVTFTKKGTTDVAYPTNAVDDAVGEYDIHLTNVTLFDEDAFSEVTCEPGLLTVDQARHLHVYAIDTNKVYGAEFPLSSLEFVATIDGTNETERVEGITVTFTDDDGNPVNPVTAPADEYQIRLSDIQGFDTNKFATVTFHPGKLTIDRQPLEITINPRQKPYGELFDFTAPGLYQVSGLVNGDAIKSIDFTCEGEGRKAEYVKTGYPITAGPEDVFGENDESLSENYDIRVNPGVLYIIPIPITITANDVTNCYGEAVGFEGTEFTVDKKLPNEEQVTEVNLKWLGPDKPDADTYKAQIKPDYEVLGINGFKTNNYTIAFSNGTLTVTQAVLTITANRMSRPFGEVLRITGTEFETAPVPEKCPYGQQVTNVNLRCDAAEKWDAPLGDYPITTNGVLEVKGSNGFDPRNYDLRFVPGVLTVTPTEFTASPEPVVKYYDGLPTNIVVKLEGLPELVTPTFEYSYAENEGYVSASAFTGPTNVAERAIEVWCRAIAPGKTNTVHATVTILPRVVVEQADSAERAYNGKPLTNAVHFFEGAAASNLAKSVYFDLARSDIYPGPARPDWADAVGFFDPDGIVTAPMTAASTITNPGTQPNAIDPDAVTFTASTKTSNYLISYLDGTLTVTLSDALTLEVSDVEKFYDAEPTNVAYVAKVGGTPIADATVRLHERGTANWVLAADFEPYLDTTNVIVDVAVAKLGYVAVTNSATLLIKPRPVTLIAATDEKTYDGTPLTNWTFDVKADTTTPGYGFVKEEGVARVEMTPESTITDLGTVDNVIATEIAKPGTKLDRNYVVSTEKGKLTVDPLGVLKVEASAAEKFYDAVPTNIAYVVKVGSSSEDLEPTNDATVRLREKGTEAWIAADDFPPYRDATNVTVEVQATKPGYFAATDEATVWVKSRIVVHHARDGEWEYDGVAHTQPAYFEDGDEEAKLSKGKWGTDEVLPNSTGFVANEGYAAGLVMTGESWIKDPGTKTNVIDRSAEKVALKAGTNPVNYELHYLDGELKVTSTAELKTTVSAKLNWNTGLLDLTLTIKNVGDGSVYPASDYWVELVPGPAGTGPEASVARTYYLNAPTGTFPNGADYVNLTAEVRKALRTAGGDEVFGPREEITLLDAVSVYHWKRWKPDTFIVADAFFVAGPLAERMGETPQQATVKARQIAVATSVDENSRSSLASDGTAQADTSLATVYDGVLYDSDALAGTIRVQLAKANKKTGLSSLTATLAPVGGKKVTLSGNFDPNAASFVATVKKDGRTLVLSIGKDGLSGTFDGLEIDGARNLYSSKDAEDKAVVASADGLIGSYSLANPCENGWETYVVKVAKKGKVTIAGTLVDGSTASASAQMIIGAMGCCVPVVVSKKSVSRAFCIWFGEDRIGIDGLDDAVIGQVGNLAAASTLRFNADTLLSLLESDTVAVLSDYLPNGAEILPNGKKWVVLPDEAGKTLKTGSLVWDRKNGVVNVEKSKIDGYNVSGLRLTYTATTGVFKGSFKVYEVVKGALKTVTGNVSGIVVDGVGYGTAKFGKSGTIGLVIK